MGQLLLVALAGFAASMVDGALGMGFGPTSSSILLGSGLSPAAASVTVNLAKVVTGLAAGASHWRLGNIDRQLVLRLAIPGAIGAVIGATVLANVDGDAIRPFLALMLIAVGIRILIRFGWTHRSDHAEVPLDEAIATRGVEASGLAGGVTNGLVGAWGPVVTPFLLHRGLSPRFSIGSVNTAEVAVAVVSAGSLLTATRGTEISVGVVGAMLLGGVAAAPVAARVIQILKPRVLALSVAALLLLTQTRELANADVLPVDRWVGYGVMLAVVGTVAALPRLRGSGVRPGLVAD